MSRPRSSDIDRFLLRRLKVMRLACGVTQQQVARQGGCQPPADAQVREGINRNLAAPLWATAQSFDIPTATLFDGYDRGGPMTANLARMEAAP
jgi:transcriptional regulator with XRE-family HTH domain